MAVSSQGGLLFQELVAGRDLIMTSSLKPQKYSLTGLPPWRREMSKSQSFLEGEVNSVGNLKYICVCVNILVSVTNKLLP